MHVSRLILLVLSLTGLYDLCPASAQPSADSAFTVILAGGMVYDGLGNAPVVADVGFSGDRIAAIGDLSAARADLRLDVSGRAVVPGFIDIHSHAASTTPGASGLFRQPLAENYLRQGVTTVVSGQDGSSPFPIDAFLKEYAAQPGTINLGLFVGHGTLRQIAMGNTARAPTGAEMERMRGMVKAAMQQGAFGLSSGLEYAPGTFAETGELISLARVAAAHGGLYISHIRDEGGRLLESVAEVVRIGEEAGLPAQVTHHKVIGKHRWGGSRASLQLLDEARQRGVDVSSDVYPYTASSTGLSILFPDWSLEGTQDERRARLHDPATRARIQEAIVRHLEEERGGDPATVVVADCAWDRSLGGKSLADLLRERGEPVTLAGAAAVAIALQEQGGCQGVFHSMSDEDVERIMRHPATMIASDGGIPDPGVGVPHPRSYGAFARVLARYVRQRQVLSFEAAVHKMAGLPHRGRLVPGAVADVAVIDPQAVTDRATFTDPHQYAEGVQHVFVAGQAVLLRGALTGARPGRVLRATEQRRDGS